MDNIVVSHDVIMNALLKYHLLIKNEKRIFVNGKALKGDYFNCLILRSSQMLRNSKQNEQFELKNISQSIRDTICPKFESSCYELETMPAVSTSTAFQPQHSEILEQEYHGETADGTNYFEDSRIASLESVRKYMLDRINIVVKNTDLPKSISNNHIFYEGLKYLVNNVLKDRQLRLLSVGHNKINCDLLIDIFQNLRFAKLMSLDLNYNKVGQKGKEYLESFLRDPNSQISSLDVWCNTIGINSLRTVEQSNASTTANFLDLSHNKTIGSGDLADLMSTLRDSPVTTLNIERNPMPFTNFGLFTSNLAATSLTGLYLGHNHLSLNNVSRLANVLKDTHITLLSLPNSGMRGERLQVLTSCLANTKIYYLNLAFNKLGYHDMECLARVLKDTQITELDIGENNLGCKSIQVFLPCLLETKVSRLVMRRNQLGRLNSETPDCIKYLASILKDTQLTFLSLEDNNIQCNRLKYIILGLPDTKITELDVRGNFICCNVFYLASLLQKTQITTIHLCSNQYAQNSHPKQFLDCFKSTSTSLNLETKDMCTISLYYLSNLLSKTNITDLNLKVNNIDYDGLKYLSQGLIGSQIVSLDLSKNNIDSTAIKYLAQVLKQTRITSLNLSYNEISFSGLKYLLEGLEGSQITSLNLSHNSISDGGIKSVINLENTKIFELNLSCNYLSPETAYQLCESVERCKRNSIFVVIGMKDVFFSERWVNLVAYSNCFIEIKEVNEEKWCDFIKNAYENVGITKLIFYDGLKLRNVNGLDRIFCNCDITEVEINCYETYSCELDALITLLLNNSNIVELTIKGYTRAPTNVSHHRTSNIFYDDSDDDDDDDDNDHDDADDDDDDVSSFFHTFNSLSELNTRALHFQNWTRKSLFGIESFIHENIMYLDFSDNCLGDNEFDTLVDALKDSNIISVNLSKNRLKSESIELLVKVLPHTKINYIDLSTNNIGHLGFQCLMDVVSETDICWLSLENNNIEKELLPEGIELSPYIVPRNDTPIAYQIRYLFSELVSLNTCNNEFEFIIPPKNSEFSHQINHYPWFVKKVLEIPNSYVHFYDLFYMKNKRHDIHVMKKFNIFVNEIEQRFRTFVENSFAKLEEAFGYESFVDLVKESEASGLNDIVKFLLLHRVLYYVDDNEEFLHPFIYKMLHKYGMPLFSLQLDQNIQQRIVAFFHAHLAIDGAQDIINWLS